MPKIFITASSEISTGRLIFKDKPYAKEDVEDIIRHRDCMLELEKESYGLEKFMIQCEIYDCRRFLRKHYNKRKDDL